MSEKGANIDLLFRNGLKDFEVLPPADVWDGIHSAVKTKSRPIVFLRIAAAITILLTVTYLTYRWSSELTSVPASQEMALNIPDGTPVFTPSAGNPVYLKGTKSIQVNQSSNDIIESDLSDKSGSIAEMPPTPEQITYFRDTRSLSLKGIEPVNGQLLSHKYNGSSIAPDIKYPDIQYMPETITPKLTNRWSVAAMASPTYYSSFSSGSDRLSDQIVSSEQPLFSYSGGLSFSYKISKRFSIQSGLYYSALGQKVDGIDSYSGFKPYDNTKGDHNFEVLTATGTVITTNPDVFLSADGSNRVITSYTSEVFDPKKASLQPVSSSLNQDFSYLEFPVVVRYKLVDKTFGVNLIGGLSYNLLVHNSVYTTIEGNKYLVGDTRGLNPLTLSSSLGMGMEYNFSEKLSLNLEPTFRYYLNSFSVSTGSYMHPYSFGIFSGFTYKF